MRVVRRFQGLHLDQHNTQQSSHNTSEWGPVNQLLIKAAAALADCIVPPQLQTDLSGRPQKSLLIHSNYSPQGHASTIANHIAYARAFLVRATTSPVADHLLPSEGVLP